MNCQQLQEAIKAGSLVKACDLLRPDVLRVQSLFQYHGGEYVDLFWNPDPDGVGHGSFSDLGQTIGQLLSMNVDPDSAVTRRHFIEDVCADLNIRRIGGQFVCKIEGENPQAVLSSFMRLGQACVRITDLFLSHRQLSNT